MKVTVRVSTEVSYSITIPDNSTVEDLKNSAKVGCPISTKLPADFKLIYNGEKLSPHYKPLSAFNIAASDAITVILMSNGSDTPINLTPKSSNTNIAAHSEVKKTKKKTKCSFKSCTSAPLRMVGACSHCSGKFCAKHRLLEDHRCQGLQFCKDNAHERNAIKLQSESTITSRV
ncbi:predicted protein [Scheffersomyces stipitis CBS 6054]|uniref:Uncharacterized protein n=1 Tax=Scheffersomyces stipitis (strain ATCC 58785 / CBS 6054 / NBRC 10063 / NRRL Y-11545) TaxID=322104 RepID=A3LUM9_PICST|nr:predicted protein [Scheffersomyces stipitis CBS 6054]ABN66619.2 predicted protein [Scheffersomyces stipitis CBS 6054]KAG2733116.1 hypothetical protein G9P44_004106 [Scheffersomyces stipitis]